MSRELFIVIEIIVILLSAGIVFASNFLSLSKSEQKKKVKEWLLYAVTMAEKQFGSKTGKIKLRYVYDLFTSRFTWIAKTITFEEFSKLVDEALEELDNLLESNEAVKEIVEEK